jgi:hypothetical protein
LGDFFGDEDVAHNFLVKIMKKCDEWDLVTGSHPLARLGTTSRTKTMQGLGYR